MSCHVRSCYYRIYSHLTDSLLQESLWNFYGLTGVTGGTGAVTAPAEFQVSRHGKIT